MENIMETIHITNKCKIMDTIEKFYVSRERKLNNQINDRLTVKPNITLETIVPKDPPRGLPAP